MEYNLLQIQKLKASPVLNDGDFIIADVQDLYGRYVTRKVLVDVAFGTENIRLSNAGEIRIDIKDPIFDDPYFSELKEKLGDELTTQDDANRIFTLAIEGLMKKVNELPNIILRPLMSYDESDPTGAPKPPELTPDPITGEPRYYPEGTLWVDTETFKMYVYFYDAPKNNKSNITRHWVSLTDR